MTFVESFLNGMAQALGFLAVFTVVFLALMMAWLKLWPRLFGKLMNGISPLMALMMTSRQSPVNPGPPPPLPPLHLCSNCGHALMLERYCPNCGDETGRSPLQTDLAGRPPG